MQGVNNRATNAKAPQFVLVHLIALQQSNDFVLSLQMFVANSNTFREWNDGAAASGSHEVDLRDMP